MPKQKNETAKLNSSLMKDINRIRKQAEAQTRINILRKYQLTLLNNFIKKLLEEGRISKEELKAFNLKKREAIKKLRKKGFEYI